MEESDEEEDIDVDREPPEPEDWLLEPSDRECESAARAYEGWLRSRGDR